MLNPREFLLTLDTLGREPLCSTQKLVFCLLLIFRPLDGGAEQLCSGFAFEFFLNVGAVHFDGSGAEIELVGHFTGGEALAETFENFFFAGGQAFDPGGFFAEGCMEHFLADIITDK